MKQGHEKENHSGADAAAVDNAGQAVPTAAASHVGSVSPLEQRVGAWVGRYARVQYGDRGLRLQMAEAVTLFHELLADLAALRQEQERFELRRDSKLADKLDAAEQRAASLHSTLAALPQEIDQVIHAIPFGFAESAHTAVEHIRGRLRSFWREKGL